MREVESQRRRSLSREWSHYCYLGGPRKILGYGSGSCRYLDAGGCGRSGASKHSFFPCLEHRAVSVMCGKLGIEKGKDIREGGRAPSEAVFRRAAVTTAAAILYTRLATGVHSEKGRPQGHVCIDHVFVTVQTIA